jgi:hypothetical protein
MATKKKRKSPKPRKPKIPAKFSVGDRVRVKYGVPDPDFPDIPLGGWAGIITEVDQDGREPLFLVEWDKYTLDHIHPVFSKRCDRDGLDETNSWLGNEDLETDIGEPVPIEKPTQIVTRPLDKGNQDDRIRAIFDLTSDDPLPEVNGENLCKYHEFLSGHLTFPFQAIYWKEIGPFQSRKCTINVTGLVALDDYYPEEGYGLLCEVRQDADSKKPVSVVQARSKNRGLLLGFLGNILGISDWQKKEPDDDENCLPLDQIEMKRSGHTKRLLADYSYWLHNH